MSGVQNLVISLGAMQVARRIPFDDPQTLLYVRIGYVGVQLFVLAVYFYISLAIKRKNDTKKLKYVQPPGPMSQEPGKLVETTVKDYDLGEVSKATRAVYTGVAMIGFLHLYMKTNPPLVVQGIMGLKGLFDSKLIAIYILGKPAEDDLKRPWKSGPAMFGASQDPQTDQAAIEAAEKEEKKAKEQEEKKEQ